METFTIPASAISAFHGYYTVTVNVRNFIGGLTTKQHTFYPTISYTVSESPYTIYPKDGTVYLNARVANSDCFDSEFLCQWGAQFTTTSPTDAIPSPFFINEN
mmetsp:Transcript_29609/g.27056  ORF Transcript_29609/g.27056 Transcript_29609/m.27056 type:complete len:103 (-) Transcript_29609:2049-2357(-)